LTGTHETRTRRLRRGEHNLLWGPRGAGKTTLLQAVTKEIGPCRCALSATKSGLEDITCALERAYAEIPTKRLTRRTTRAQPWRDADADPAVLLLDHVTRVPTAMKGWLRRLRGGVAGTLLTADIDSPRERERLRAMKIGCSMASVPPIPPRPLARQLATLLAAIGGPPLRARTRRALIRAARGRPGWLVQCAALAGDGRYWQGGQLRVHLLMWDTGVHLLGFHGGERTAAGPQTLGVRLQIDVLG